MRLILQNSEETDQVIIKCQTPNLQRTLLSLTAEEILTGVQEVPLKIIALGVRGNNILVRYFTIKIYEQRR